MINIEYDIFTAVAQALRAAHAGIYVTEEYVSAPSKFPAVSIIEADNHVVPKMRTTNIENAAAVMYEVNIYSNKVSGKKAEAKAIADTLDAKFAEIGFTRTSMNQVPNWKDGSIYRIVCRYEAIVDKDLWVYQN